MFLLLNIESNIVYTFIHYIMLIFNCQKVYLFCCQLQYCSKKVLTFYFFNVHTRRLCVVNCMNNFIIFK